MNLVSSRAGTSASGSVQIKLGFLAPETPNHSMNFDEIYEELLRRSRDAHMTLLSAPPTEGIGTIRTNDTIPAYEDDGLSTDEDLTDEEYEEREDELPISLSQSPPSTPTLEQAPDTSKDGVPNVNIVVPSPISPSTVSPLPVPTPKTSLGAKIPRVFKKRPTLTPASSSDSGAINSVSSSPGLPSPTTPSRPTTPGTPATVGKRARFRRKWRDQSGDYNFTAAHDIIGIVMLDIKSAVDLPKLRNSKKFD